MKIIVCPDSFKGSLSSAEAADAIARGILKAAKSLKIDKSSPVEIIKIPLADGGEGTVQALAAATSGKILRTNVLDPLGRTITAFYGISGDGNTAIIEMAAASGLTLLKESERNPLITSTYGTGQLLLAAVAKGVKKIVIGIGGSATNDGGSGAMSALGVKFLDKNNRLLPPGGAALANLKHIDITGLQFPLSRIKLEAACDVTNPLCGKYGASAVYGPQKGATPAMVKQLDLALVNYARVIKKDLGKDVGGIPGSGAAGGLGAGLTAFLNARLRSGIDMVLDAAGFDKAIADADLIITGEGRIDEQTAYGKTIGGVLKRLKKNNKKIKIMAFCGSIKGDLNTLKAAGLSEVQQIIRGNISLEFAMKNAAQLLSGIAAEAFTSYIEN